MIVVIPTAREIRLDYLAPLIDGGARFIVVDDSEGRVRIDHKSFQVFNWKDAEKMLGRDVVAIPRRNGACRDLGFLIAYRDSDEGELIVALDDDCVVEDECFGTEIPLRLSAAPRPEAKNPSPHLNILDLYRETPANLFPRGFPYSARAPYTPAVFDQCESIEERRPVFNLGLWKGAFDVNAIDKIRGPKWIHPDAELIHESVLCPKGALISVCSMNMHFVREIIPAVYQFPMHIETMPGWVIDRYGDIWGGFLLKTLMDIKGDWMSFGGPMIYHAKEGPYEKNIWQEHVCHMVNDEFIQFLDTLRENVTPGDYVDMMGQTVERLGMGDFSPMLAPYVAELSTSMAAWVRCLSRP